MAAPDFPAAPTVGQIYTAPSGNIYKWDGTVWQTSSVAPLNAYWTDTGTALTPTTASRAVAIASPAPDHDDFIVGSRTIKFRGGASTGADVYYWMENHRITDGLADDSSKARYYQSYDLVNDQIEFARMPGGGSAWQSLLRLDGAGRLNVPSGADASQLVAGSTTIKERIRMRSSILQAEMSINRTDADGQDDPSKATWTILEDLNGDNVAIYRKPPGGSWGASSLSVNSAGIT